MTEKTAQIIAEGMAEELSLDELLEEKAKSKRPGVVKGIEKELTERNYSCPNCDNLLMRNEQDQIWYCPTGHYKVEE
jgi:ribosomal protein S27AE